ncbi:MAG: NUDIX domain-containing protein [Nanoarchaeota archaeon]
MSKFDKQIVCVNTADLLEGQYFQGFMPASHKAYAERICAHMHGRRRGDVEEDPSVKQLVGYALVVHPNSKTVFGFQRSADQTKYSEKRLHGKWSWGVGGHIESIDTGADPVAAGLRRELAEEGGLTDGYTLELLGYINDDRDPIGKVHFGVLYLVKVDKADLHPADGELASGDFLTIDELREVAASPDCTVEGWSHIALEPCAAVLSGKPAQPKSF